MGGMNGAWTGAYNPALGLAYIPAIESCQRYKKGLAVFVRGAPFLGGVPDTIDAVEGKAYGLLHAIEVATGQIRWRYREKHPLMAGALSTAGGVVFTGTLDGRAIALDARSGELLWSFRMGGGVRSQPVAFELDGRSYVVYGSGSWSTTDAYIGGIDRIPEAGQLFVFALPAN
jgi:alcohol dehydrogenase (cytochrome c)